MSELSDFKQAIISQRIVRAHENNEIGLILGLKEEQRRLKNQESYDSGLRQARFLKSIGTKVIAHFVDLDIPKTRLLTRTIAGKNLSSLSIVATGWIISLDEKIDDYTGQQLYDGVLIQKLTGLNFFSSATADEHVGLQAYVINNYGHEFTDKPIDIMHSHYPDFEEDVAGSIRKYKCDDIRLIHLIKGTLVDTAIALDLKI